MKMSKWMLLVFLFFFINGCSSKTFMPSYKGSDGGAECYYVVIDYEPYMLVNRIPDDFKNRIKKCLKELQ